MNSLPSMRSRMAIMLLTAGCLTLGGTAHAEPCNPIVDGTYFATQMPKNTGLTSTSSSRMKAIEDMTRVVPSGSVGNSQPGTLVDISFQSKGRCFGLLRRSVCD